MNKNCRTNDDNAYRHACGSIPEAPATRNLRGNLVSLPARLPRPEAGGRQSAVGQDKRSWWSRLLSCLVDDLAVLGATMYPTKESIEFLTDLYASRATTDEVELKRSHNPGEHGNVKMRSMRKGEAGQGRGVSD